MVSFLPQVGKGTLRHLTLPPKVPVISIWRQTRFQASLASSSRDLGSEASDTNRAETTLKRFWKTVGLERRDCTYAVTLDKRTLKTPSGNSLLFPDNKIVVATLVASEWDNQETLMKPHSLPVTSLASRAIDAFDDEAVRAGVRSQLLKYLETDTVCFHSSEPPGVVELQGKHWSPLLEWTRDAFAVEIYTTDGLFLPPHPPATLKKFDEILSQFDQWQMAAMERAVYASKSFIIGLALIMRRINVEQAAQAAHVEVNSQIGRWGEVEDSHDVDYQDIRRQLGSAASLLVDL